VIVVDANVAVKFSVRQPLSDRAIELLWTAKPIVGPDLVVAEVVIRCSD
jgi:predicted nucleic acid-binding protein